MAIVAITKPPADWRGEALARIRKLIAEADPEMVETVKWRKPSKPDGVPVFEHDGIVLTGETYRNYVKLTFARGASLADPSRLFNASLEGGTRRAIDLHEGARIDGRAFKALIGEAVALNRAAKASRGAASAAGKSRRIKGFSRVSPGKGR